MKAHARLQTLLAPHRSAGEPADRDLAQQLQRIHEIATEFDRWNEAKSADAHLPGRRRLYDAADMADRLKWARKIGGDGGKMVQARLEAAAAGEWRTVAQAPEPAVLAPLLPRFPNFTDVTHSVQRQLALCQRSDDKLLRLQPLLLAGDPGIGKTAFTYELARLLSVPYHQIDVATLSAGFSLAGLDASYTSSKPGLIWDALDGPCLSPLLLLDELDKVPRREDMFIGCLYPLLERRTARRFKDAALLLQMDCSHLLWIATCNVASDVEPALRSRFHVIDVPAPTAAQAPQVIASVQHALIEEADWATGFDHELDADVMGALCAMTPRELRQSLEQAYANAASTGRSRLQATDISQPNRNHRHAIGFCV